MAEESYKAKYHRNLREIVESYPLNQEFILEDVRKELAKRSISVKIMSISNVLSRMRIACVAQMGQGTKKPTKWRRDTGPIAKAPAKPVKKTLSTAEKKQLVVDIIEAMPPGKQFRASDIMKKVRDAVQQSVSWQLVAGQIKLHQLASNVRADGYWIWERNEARPLPCCGTRSPNAHTHFCKEVLCPACRHPVNQHWPCEHSEHMDGLRRKEQKAVEANMSRLDSGHLTPSTEVAEARMVQPTVYLPAEPETPKAPRPDPEAKVTLDDLGVTISGPISGITEVMRAYKNWIEFKATWKYPERKRH